MARDRRFVAIHRGGQLDPTKHRLLAEWAADCAERAMPLYIRRHPTDPRPARAIEVRFSARHPVVSEAAAMEVVPKF
jgi:immunity protein 5 of polymorphic toxin system